MAHPPLRDLVLDEMARRHLKPADLSRLLAAAREPPADPRSVEATLGGALTGHPKRPGGRTREMSEGLFLEILDVLGLEVALIPRRGK